MTKKGIINIHVLIVVLSVFFIGMILLSIVGGSIGGTQSDIFNKKEITCDIGISNPLLGDVRIETVQCTKGNTCYFSNPLAYFGMKDTGILQLRSTDDVDNIKFALWESEGANTKLSVCTAENIVIIEALDDAKRTTDTKTVEVK